MNIGLLKQDRMDQTPEKTGVPDVVILSSQHLMINFPYLTDRKKNAIHQIIAGTLAFIGKKD